MVVDVFGVPSEYQVFNYTPFGNTCRKLVAVTEDKAELDKILAEIAQRPGYTHGDVIVYIVNKREIR